MRSIRRILMIAVIAACASVGIALPASATYPPDSMCINCGHCNETFCCDGQGNLYNWVDSHPVEVFKCPYHG